MHRHLRHTLYGLFTANAKGTDGCVVVLEEDGTVDEDDVVKELQSWTKKWQKLVYYFKI